MQGEGGQFVIVGGLVGWGLAAQRVDYGRGKLALVAGEIVAAEKKGLEKLGGWAGWVATRDVRMEQG